MPFDALEILYPDADVDRPADDLRLALAEGNLGQFMPADEFFHDHISPIAVARLRVHSCIIIAESIAEHKRMAHYGMGKAAVWV